MIELKGLTSKNGKDWSYCLKHFPCKHTVLGGIFLFQSKAKYHLLNFGGLLAFYQRPTGCIKKETSMKLSVWEQFDYIPPPLRLNLKYKSDTFNTTSRKNTYTKPYLITNNWFKSHSKNHLKIKLFVQHRVIFFSLWNLHNPATL